VAWSNGETAKMGRMKMVRGSRDLVKFLQNENGKRFKRLGHISSKQKWQEVQGTWPNFYQNENGKRLKKNWKKGE
jgi:hypothetical protein